MTPLLRSTLPILGLGAAIAVFASISPAAETDSPSRPDAPNQGPHKSGPLARILAPNQDPGVILERLTKHLELTDDQKTQVQAILESARGDLKETAEGGKAILESTREKIEAVLTPEQREKFAATRERMKERVREFRKEFRGDDDERPRSFRPRQGGPEGEDGPRGPGRPGGPPPLIGALRSLNLTDEQTSQVRDLAQAQRPQREAIHKETREKMEALDKSLKDQVEAVLTTEQKARLQERLEEIQENPRSSGGPEGRRDNPGRFGPGDRRGGRPDSDDDDRGPRPERRRGPGGPEGRGPGGPEGRGPGGPPPSDE